jgi:RHS repeat-associated protein
MAEQHSNTADFESWYKLNGKELDPETGYYYYGARYYDPSISLWLCVDPLAHKHQGFLPYNYVKNNPIMYIDPDGRAPLADFFNIRGKKIGTDGVNNGRKFIVTNKSEVKQIKRTNKKNGTTQVSSLNSAEILPSDTALSESLNVLTRTKAPNSSDTKGGLHGESSIVMNDGTVLRGPSGSKATIDSNNMLVANETLPKLPSGTTTSDVEVTIHSHVTGIILQNGQIYSHDATQPSNTDIGTFGQYSTNIIVGPIGQASANISNGNIQINQPPNGIAIYSGNSTTPRIVLKVKAVKRIINSN